MISIAIVPLLAACASTGNIKGDFQCAAPGGTCAPMSVIDAAAVSSMGNVRSPMGISDPVSAPRSLSGPFVAEGSPPRTSDRVLRVVFPAHIDADGIYREESAAHAVVENAAWAEALGARPAAARGTPSLRTSGIVAEQTPRSALATLDEIVAARAAQSSAPDATRASANGVIANPPPAPLAPANTATAVESPRSEPTSSFSGFSSRSAAPQSLAEVAAGLSAPKLPALDPRIPAANYDTPDVVAARSDKVLASSSAPMPVVGSLTASKRAGAAQAPSDDRGVKTVSASAPYGTRPVCWKGRTYEAPYKTPQLTSPAELPSQPNPTAELNKAALAKASAARPESPAVSTVVAVGPTKDAQVAMARVRAMAAPIIANGVDKGRQAASDAAPEGFKLPIGSTASVPK
jgi:conjugal transfer pilus assembly protein TraV